jgi:hypothetical protein
MKTYKWTKENKFFLTRDGDIEIFHSDDEWEWELFHFGNQYLEECFGEGIDMFGRNETDKLFIRLCFAVHYYVIVTTAKNNVSVTFKYLSCKKIDNQYIVHLELSNETLEMELNEMATLFEEKAKNS